MKKELSDMTLEELWELFPIILKKHNPMYKEWYLEEKENIEKLLDKNTIIRINHIGSSAIKGLISKPTVDILLEIESDTNVDEIIEIFKNVGWELMSFNMKPELKISLCKGYTPNGFADKVFHIHIRHFGNWDELYFRDYLMSNRNVAKKYEKLKEELKDKYMYNRDGYTDGKTEFINEWTKKARKKYRNKYLGIKGR